jgi:hypothetical protein
MNTNTSLSQFVKGGIVGVAFVLPMFFFVQTERDYVLGLMVLVILTAFMGVGIGQRFLATITSRKDWIVAAAKISGVSFLVGVGLSAIYWGYVQFGEPIDDFLFFMIASILSTGSGAIIGFILGGLAGIVFHPQSAFFRSAIGTMVSVLVAYGVGLVAILFS